MHHARRDVDDRGVAGCYCQERLRDDEGAFDIGFEARPPVLQARGGDRWRGGHVGRVVDEDVDRTDGGECGGNGFLVGYVGDEGEDFGGGVSGFEGRFGGAEGQFCAAGYGYG